MRLLLIHSDFIEFKATKKTRMAEDTTALSGSLEEVLVAFCAVESDDADAVEAIIKKTAQEIAQTAQTVLCQKIMVYPYAHLSNDLSSPDVAVTVLKGIEKELSQSFTVERAPFGWYKSFTISCKGHPLSELSRTITSDEIQTRSSRPDITHTFFVLTPDGVRHETSDFNNDDAFGALIKKETGIAVPVGGEPIHVELMRSKELVDYEQASDVGHLRWLPRGKLIRDLLADYALSLVLSYGASPVETPVMYDLDDKAIFEHADKFGERQYRFKSGNRTMMLRFAACFGMFSIMRDMHISHNQLPMKMYELSTYSFRHEQKGEVIGLKRLRAFTMPDMHTLCRDMQNALSCFEEQVAIGWQTGQDLGTDLVGVFRCTDAFYQEHEGWIKNLVCNSGVPLLIETISERVHYWIAKIDLAAIDGQNRPIENPTVQIDVESAKRFDIRYHLDGEVVYPPILHCSPTGSIERVICAILENTQSQTVPRLPTWLSPVIVRVIPIAERHAEYAKGIIDRLNRENIRADMDDRDITVGKKVREAGVDWVPYVVVVGDEELSSGELTVTIRSRSDPKKPYKEAMTLGELITMVHAGIQGMPYRPLYTPHLLSQKPHYI
ncbi:MAG: threonine--tRNA ligase [Methanospirillaceae archaeon]|nr:threonine--tRNA ligase [Methanospirillaceae archaeon]